MLARQQAERQTQYNCGLGVRAIGQHGRRSVWLVFLWCGVLVFFFGWFFFCFFFFLILCNDAPTTVDGGAERSWVRGCVWLGVVVL